MATFVFTGSVFASDAKTDWTGPYVGAYAGTNSNNATMADYWCYSTCSTQSVRHTAIAGGVSGGYDWQIDENFVVGLEADVGTGATSHSHFLDGASAASDWVYDFTAKQKWNAALRGRAGLAVNKTLLYVTGGLAFDSSEFTSAATYRASGTYYRDYVSQTGAKNRTGYVFGAGVEHKFNGQLSVKAEYLRSEFGQNSACYRYRGESAPYFATCFNLPPSTTSSSNWNSSNDSLRVGINYRF